MDKSRTKGGKQTLPTTLLIHEMEGFCDNFRIEVMEKGQENDSTVPRKTTQRENNVAECTKEEASPARKKQRPLGMGSKQVNSN